MSDYTPPSISLNGLTISPTTGTLTLANGKIATWSNTLTLAGTDGSTLNVGSGGTLGSAAFSSIPIAGLVSSSGSAFSSISTSAALAALISDKTGSGALVFGTSPTLGTPILGTPQSVTLTNGTGLPISTGVSGLGTGVATFLATPTSTNLAGAVTDEIGYVDSTTKALFGNQAMSTGDSPTWAAASVSKSLNNPVYFTATNTSAGAAAQAISSLVNNSGRTVNLAFTGTGYSGSEPFTADTGYLLANANGGFNIISQNSTAAMRFYVGGVTAANKILTLDPSAGILGNTATVRFGKSSAEVLVGIFGSAGTNRSLFFQTNSSHRWALYEDDLAESGSNAGSNLWITRFNDAGAGLGDILFVKRDTGHIIFGGDYGGIPADQGGVLQVLGETLTNTSGSTYGLSILRTYNQATGNASNTDLFINRTETAIGSGSQKLIDAQVSSSSKFSVDRTGVVMSSALTASKPVFTDASKNLVSGSFPLPQIVAQNHVLGATASNASVTTCTTPNDSTIHCYRVGGAVNITAISAGTLTVQISFTDRNSVAQTLTYFAMGVTSSGLTTTGYTGFATMDIWAKDNTAITFKTSFTGVSITYDVGGTITSLY